METEHIPAVTEICLTVDDEELKHHSSAALLVRHIDCYGTGSRPLAYLKLCIASRFRKCNCREGVH